MIGFELLRPGLAWLLVLVPLALWYGWVGLARSRAELARWVVERHRERFLPGTSPARSRARLVLGALGLLCLALALLGPVRGFTYRSVSQKGLDLVLCLDTSRSMLAQDLRPSRLERAKREIIGLLDHLRGDRVALVAFSGDARDVAPLTRDRATLESLLAYATPEDNREGGTDLAAAIAHALSLFDGRTGAHEAIVLLTDGEDLAGEAAAQAEEAAQRGIRVFIVGVGTQAGGKIPVTDADGRQSFLCDPDGTEVVTKLERESLAALAAVTGGEYLSAEEAPTALEDLYRARIQRIQGREVEGGERRVPYDHFQWPLSLGLLCFLIELGLRARGGVTNRARGGPRLAAALLPVLGLASQEPFSPARALADIVRHHRAGESSEAVRAATALVEQAGGPELGEYERAKAHFALGVVAATGVLENPPEIPPKDGEEGAPLSEVAREAFSAARALAGPGPLRLDAIYDLGTLELVLGERVRATIPELSGQGPGVMPAPHPAGPVAGARPGVPAADPPDPLDEARKQYLAARNWFLERLRLDWRDEDTRANLELIQRRLHELDELEKQREEQKQQDQQDQQDQEPNPDQDQKDSDPKNSDQKDQDQEDSDQKDQDGKQDPDKPQDGEDSKPDPESNPGDESEQPPSEESKPEESEDSKGQEPPQPEEEAQDDPESAGQPPSGGMEAEPPAERMLTREEVMRLLDKLGDLEKQQKALEALLRARRRSATQRDW